MKKIIFSITLVLSTSSIGQLGRFLSISATENDLTRSDLDSAIAIIHSYLKKDITGNYFYPIIDGVTEFSVWEISRTSEDPQYIIYPYTKKRFIFLKVAQNHIYASYQKWTIKDRARFRKGYSFQ